MPGASFEKITNWLLNHQSCIPPEHAEAYSMAMMLAFQPGIPLPDVFSQAAKPASAAQDSNTAAASATQTSHKMSPQNKQSLPEEKAAAGAPVNLSKAAAASPPSGINVPSNQAAKGSAQAAISDGNSGNGSALAPSKKSAGDQSHPRGLAKGFFSKSSSSGGKSASPASSVAQAEPAFLEASKAKRSANHILLEVPESWFSCNREMDHVIAASLRELDQRLTSFLGHFKGRSTNLQHLLQHWGFLDHAVRHHVDQLRGMCGDLENNVVDFVALEDDPEVEGPYAVYRTEDLLQDVRGIYVPRSYECSIAGVEDMLEMYQVSIHYLLNDQYCDCSASDHTRKYPVQSFGIISMMTLLSLCMKARKRPSLATGLAVCFNGDSTMSKRFYSSGGSGSECLPPVYCSRWLMLPTYAQVANLLDA